MVKIPAVATRYQAWVLSWRSSYKIGFPECSPKIEMSQKSVSSERSFSLGSLSLLLKNTHIYNQSSLFVNVKHFHWVRFSFVCLVDRPGLPGSGSNVSFSYFQPPGTGICLHCLALYRYCCAFSPREEGEVGINNCHSGRSGWQIDLKSDLKASSHSII